jgi:hypothetical protein
VVEKGVPHADVSIRRETLHADRERVSGFSEDFCVIQSIVREERIESGDIHGGYPMGHLALPNYKLEIRN